MDVAIVTGAASGVGFEIARKLVDSGFRVYGVGGDYSSLSYRNDFFVPTPCDLCDLGDLQAKFERIVAKEGNNICVLVNNAKYYPRPPFAETSLNELENSLKINLLCPVALTRLSLPSLSAQGGHVINIGPTTQEEVRGGPVGAAASGGLKWMSEALWESCRDLGMRVTTIYPRVNSYRPADAGKPGQGAPSLTSITPEAVADAVIAVINAGSATGNVTTELVLRPQATRETGIAAVRHVPGLKVAPYKPPKKRAEQAEHEVEPELDMEDEEDRQIAELEAKIEQELEDERNGKRNRKGASQRNEPEKSAKAKPEETPGKESAAKHADEHPKSGTRQTSQDASGDPATTPKDEAPVKTVTVPVDTDPVNFAERVAMATENAAGSRKRRNRRRTGRKDAAELAKVYGQASQTPKHFVPTGRAEGSGEPASKNKATGGPVEPTTPSASQPQPASSSDGHEAPPARAIEPPAPDSSSESRKTANAASQDSATPDNGSGAANKDADQPKPQATKKKRPSKKAAVKKKQATKKTAAKKKRAIKKKAATKKTT